MEFPATGGVVPSYSIRTVKLIRYVTTFDFFVLACEGIFCAFILYYLIEEILEFNKMRCAYFKNFWNIVDMFVIVVSLTATVPTLLAPTYNVSLPSDLCLLHRIQRLPTNHCGPEADGSAAEPRPICQLRIPQLCPDPIQRCRGHHGLLCLDQGKEAVIQPI